MSFSNTEEGFVLSSLNEFVKVWGSGGQANLNLECKDGLACIKLKFDLGHPGQPHIPRPQYLHPAYQTKPRRYGPSRQRKNLERAKAHHDAKSVAASATDNSSTDDSSATSPVTVTAPEAPTSSKTPSPCTAAASTPAPAATEEQQSHETAPSNSTSSLPAAATAAVSLTPTEAASASSTPSPSQPSTVPVYCIAVLENCPDEKLSQEYEDSLRRYLASEEHLSRNILSAQFVHETTRSLRNSFTHTVAVLLQVKTERLWESAASYIRKHLGASNEWSRGNGTVIKLSRIH